MKKLITTTAVAVCAAIFTGCAGLTGRNNTADVKIILEKEAALALGSGGLARTNNFEDVTHPGNLYGFVVINQHVWTDTQGNEGGPVNAPNFPVDVTANYKQTKSAALPNVCATHGTANCPDGGCGD
jgi:hypothetical protein